MSKVVPLHPQTEYITDAQCRAILGKIAETEARADLFCAYMDVPSIEKLPSHEYQRAIDALDARAARAREPITIAQPNKPSQYRSAVIEWIATDASEGRVDPLHIVDLAAEVYAEIDELRALTGAPQKLRRAGGRPPKAFIGQLAGYGGGWLGVNGIPSEQAKLERALLDECERQGWKYSESSVRELAADLIRGWHEAVDRLD
jgi:hypothetical protein